jgi:hypothetical protein
MYLDIRREKDSELNWDYSVVNFFVNVILISLLSFLHISTCRIYEGFISKKLKIKVYALFLQ